MSARISRRAHCWRCAYWPILCPARRQSRQPPWPAGSAGMTHPRAAASGQGGCVLAVFFPRTAGSGRLRDVDDNRHSRGDSWAAGQPVGALEEAGLAVGSRTGRSEGGVDGADRAGAVAHRGGDAFHRPGPDVADSEDQRLAGLERQRAAAQLSPGHAGQRAIQVGAGEHEAVVIDGDVLEPAGGRGGADKAEQAPGMAGCCRIGRRPALRGAR
jgi:hypothetical protein